MVIHQNPTLFTHRENDAAAKADQLQELEDDVREQEASFACHDWWYSQRTFGVGDDVVLEDDGNDGDGNDDGANGDAVEPTHSSGIEADEGGEKENGVDADLHDRHVLLHWNTNARLMWKLIQMQNKYREQRDYACFWSKKNLGIKQMDIDFWVSSVVLVLCLFR